MPRKLKCTCGHCKLCHRRKSARRKRGRPTDQIAFTGKWPHVRLSLTPLDVLVSGPEGFGLR